jgi:hypothetical protein
VGLSPVVGSDTYTARRPHAGALTTGDRGHSAPRPLHPVRPVHRPGTTNGPEAARAGRPSGACRCGCRAVPARRSCRAVRTRRRRAAPPARTAVRSRRPHGEAQGVSPQRVRVAERQLGHQANVSLSRLGLPSPSNRAGYVARFVVAARRPEPARRVGSPAIVRPRYPLVNGAALSQTAEPLT